MSVKATIRHIGDVEIVDLSGRITLGEGSVVLRDTVKDLLAQGKTKILMNLASVSYIDSSGIGELVCAHISIVGKRHGALKVLHMTTKVHDLLQITKFYTLFDVYDDEELCLKSFEFSRYCKCPSCGSLSKPPSLDSRLCVFTEQTCPECETEFAVYSARGAKGREVLIKRIRLKTYEQEYFEIVAGPPYSVRLIGRLNLFSSSALDRVWRVIPPPRQVIFELGSVTDVDAPGWYALCGFLQARGADCQMAVSLEGINPAFTATTREAQHIYMTRKQALAALGNISDTPGWVVDIVEMTGGQSSLTPS